MFARLGRPLGWRPSCKKRWRSRAAFIPAIAARDGSIVIDQFSEAREHCEVFGEEACVKTFTIGKKFVRELRFVDVFRRCHVFFWHGSSEYHTGYKVSSHEKWDSYFM